MNLTQLGFHKYAKDSSLLSDFIGGIDPTGVKTFNNATNNQKNHALHRNVGVAGGFIGGAAISTALGAAGTYGMSRLLKNKPIGEYLLQGAKDQMSLFNPMKTFKTLKATPAALETLTTGNALNKRALGHLDDPLRGAADKGMQALSKEYVDKAKNFDLKYKEDADAVGARGLAMVGGLAAGGLGGGLNALSAHVQYNAGRKAGEKERLATKPGLGSLYS